MEAAQIVSSHGHLKTRAASSPSSHRANRSGFRSERSRINDSIIPLKKSIFSILYSMKYQRYSLIAALALLAAPCQKATADQFRSGLSWSTVVNNLDDIPGTTTKFNSYNQPSINSQGYLVFRARGKGTEGPLSGIFARDLSAETPVTVTIADRNTQVPSPSNTTYPPDDLLSMFTEFPSIPRISANQRTIATRGNHKPVWTYLVGETESRAGTTGIFVNPGGVLSTGVSILGAVPEPSGGVIGVDYFPYFAVPDAPAGTKFDVFPGSPSITDFDVIAFKGNYTDVTPKTGVFYRDLVAENGLAPVQLIANSNTEIPGFPGVLFGSTAWTMKRLPQRVVSTGLPCLRIPSLPRLSRSAMPCQESRMRLSTSLAKRSLLTVVMSVFGRLGEKKRETSFSFAPKMETRISSLIAWKLILMVLRQPYR